MSVARLWHSGGVWSGARTALLPAEGLYRGVVRTRNALYDAGWLSSDEPAIPALSVGNLTVGGTGKTPVAAHVATELARRGARPAIVLRGYGADEPLVHARLNPGVPVITRADRVAGAREAARHGCDVVVLDDAFQHRAVRRVSDIVVVAAEQWTDAVRCLPCGPYREPLASLRRATLVLVTRKAASEEAAHAVGEALGRQVAVPIAVAALTLDRLQRMDLPGETMPLESVAGNDVLAIAGVGDPRAFVRQLERAGGRVAPAPFADHHAFGDDDVRTLVHRAERATLVVCTLKDAVKLAPMWPRAAPPLWYVSQRVVLERGANWFDDELRRLLDARSAGSPTSPGRSRSKTS